MKLSSQAFPYPVLAPSEGVASDYIESAFQASLDFTIIDEKKSLCNIEYNFTLSNSEINDLIKNNNASFAIGIICKDTLRREIYFVDENGNLKFDAKNYYGTVEFTPQVLVRKNKIKYTSDDLNTEFEGSSFKLNIGDVLAYDDTITKYIEFNQTSFESLVKIVVNDDIDNKLSYKIELTPNIIMIEMGESLKRIWDELSKSSTQNKSLLVMSIYKDLMYAAFVNLATNPEADGQLWARALKVKLGELGIDLPSKDKLEEFNPINLMSQEIIEDLGVKKLLKEIKKQEAKI